MRSYNEACGLLEEYERTLRNLQDTPLKRRTITLRSPSPWYDEDIGRAERKRWKLERRWRASRLSVNRQTCVEQCLVVDNMLKKAKASYYSSIISENASNQKVLFSSRQIIESQTSWETLSNLVLRPTWSSTTEIANSFFPILSKIK